MKEKANKVNILIGLPGAGKTKLAERLSEDRTFSSHEMFSENHYPWSFSKLIKAKPRLAPYRTTSIIDVLIRTMDELEALVELAKAEVSNSEITIHVFTPDVENSLFNDDLRVQRQERSRSAAPDIRALAKDWPFTKENLSTFGVIVKTYDTYVNPFKDHVEILGDKAYVLSQLESNGTYRFSIDGDSLDAIIPWRLSEVIEAYFSDIQLTISRWNSIIDAAVRVETRTEYGWYDTEEHFIDYFVDLRILYLLSEQETKCTIVLP